jgi:diguanylate cyclase (GGDEF)-like protein
MRALEKLAALADGRLPAEEAVQGALTLLKEELNADDAFLVYGSDDGFQTFGSAAELGLHEVGLWLVHRYLTSESPVCAFDVTDDHVVDLRPATDERACRYVAALLPTPAHAGDMLVAPGFWPSGFGAERSRWLHAALPALALVLMRRLSLLHAEQHRNQLNALANITRVVSASEDLETVVRSVASTIAVVAEVDYVSIDLTDADGNAWLRCTNVARAGVAQIEGRWKRGAVRPDPIREEVLATRRAVLLPDVQNDERVPESGRTFFVHTLIRSAAVFPLVAKDDVLGVLSIASHRPLTFSTQNVELLEGLTAQVAGVVKGVQVYQELARSRGELQRLNDQLQESMGIEHWLARTDALTGIPNRRFIDETLRAEIARTRRHGQPLSVVLADLDVLKEINDTYSHLAGDEVLRAVAGLARDSCREVDMVGRYGGDEFVFVLPATPLQQAATFAERFRQQLARHTIRLSSGEAVSVAASLGVAQWDGETMSGPESLIRQADRVMYQAKQSGRNRTMLAAGDSALVA